MPAALKDLYSRDFFDRFSVVLQNHVDGFDSKNFISLIYDKDWKQRELKDRMKHVSRVLAYFMPGDFRKAAPLLRQITDTVQREKIASDFVFMLIPEYIESYGLKEFDTSVKLMERVTQFTSCEFAVRPFIKTYGQAMLKQMLSWASHQHPRVRRLASEGCRPRLPWAMALPELKKDPSPILPILEKLKDDPDEWVRKSVANNLNDISKDNPSLALHIFKKWKGKSKGTDWIIKHASRTLLKQGDPGAIELIGYHTRADIRIHDLHISRKQIKLNQDLHFTFTLENKSAEAAHIRLEYGVYYRKANGSLSKKVFKISEREYAPFSKTTIERKQHFREITTRKYHAGEHALSIIINGKEQGKMPFSLYIT